MILAARVALSVVALGLAGCAPHATSTTAPQTGGTLVFFDDFSGPTLDRATWNVEVTGVWVNDEKQAYVDEPSVIHVENGALVLEAHDRTGFVTPDGKRFDFVSGRINTRGKMEFAYGTAAARIRMMAGDGLWPAFWALGNGPWPDTGEIDIMEFVGVRDWTSVALHGPGYSGDTPLVHRAIFPPATDATAWHVYAVDWTPDSLIFRVDDTIVYRATRLMIERYGRWAFDNPKFLILNLALGGVYPAAVNGVKEPYSGLPASTVSLIKSGEARMLVDWVKVTRIGTE